MAPMFGTPGSMSLPSGSAANSGLLRRPRLPSTRAAQALAVAGIAATAGAGVHLQRSGAFGSLRERQGAGFKLPRPMMEVICGAVGEIVQVACLFPLDTIKVRCQASGQGARQVTAQLLKGGLTRNVIGQLYAGVVSTSICSVAIGSLYYLTFCTAKRAAESASSADSKPSKQQGKQQLEQKQQQRQQQGKQQKQQQEDELPNLSDEVDYRPHVLLASITSSAISSSSGSSSSKHGAPGEQQTPASAETAAAAGDKEKGDSLGSNLFASCAAALVGALVEAPVELFKHQAQVGMLQGNMLAHMATTARTGGLGALYPSFLPFMFKSLPFDIGELLTYSQLQDARGSAAGKGSALAALPPHALDMAIGAAAGAVAVLVSAPMDCIKTCMETSPNLGAGSKGPLAGVSEFAATARQLVAKNGPKALYVGIGPRMLEQVPSTMLYWLAVEGCRRMLEPYTTPA